MKEQVFAVWWEELEGFMATLNADQLSVFLQRLLIALAAECPDEKAVKILKFLEAEMRETPIILTPQ